MTRTHTRLCPKCSIEVHWPDTPTYPFCSKRCRLIDLGLWARGDYRIPTDEPLDEDAWLELSAGETEELEEEKGG